MKKRIVAGMMAAMMMVGAVGCGSTGGKDKSSDAEYTIGIAQFAEHGSLDNCREGFLEGLKEELVLS